MARNTRDVKPFPLADILRDLAFLRVSGVDLSALPSSDIPTVHHSFDGTVHESYEFVHEARMALMMHNRGRTASLSKKLEELRNTIDDVSLGVQIQK
jgi:hypothetical protein